MFFNSDKMTDDMVMFNILEGIEFYSGTERKTMLKVDKGNGSMLWGTTWRGHLTFRNGEQILRERDPNSNLYYTKVRSDNPHLGEIFTEYAEKYLNGFDYSQVQMNKSFPCPKHTDKNIGESICVAFGEYIGGELIIEMEDKVIMIDPRLKPVKFDGKKYPHWVNEFSGGDRYSLVFFSN